MFKFMGRQLKHRDKGPETVSLIMFLKIKNTKIENLEIFRGIIFISMASIKIHLLFCHSRAVNSKPEIETPYIFCLGFVNLLSKTTEN